MGSCMGVSKYVVGSIPLLFVIVGLASAASGVIAPSGEAHPVAGTLLVLVGLTLFLSLWLVGWWSGAHRRTV